MKFLLTFTRHLLIEATTRINAVLMVTALAGSIGLLVWAMWGME